MQITTDGNAIIVKVAEDGCAGLWKLLEPHLAGGKKAVVMDFTGVQFINSVNIAAVIAVRNRAQTAGVAFHAAGLQERVRSIFRVLRLDRLFPLDLDLATAVAVSR